MSLSSEEQSRMSQYEDLFQTFSDLYKDVNGFRPRFAPPASEIEEWLAAYRKWAEADFKEGLEPL